MYDNFFLLLILVAGGLYWWSASRDKELARLYGRHACDREGLQFLDDTVILNRARLRRNDRGQLVIRREYRFEFASDGGRRYEGYLVLLGHRLVQVTLEPYRIQ